MKRGLTIYVPDDSEVSFLHGTIYIKQGEQTGVQNLSFTPPDSKAVLVSPGKDIMAVAEQEPQTAAGKRRNAKRD